MAGIELDNQLRNLWDVVVVLPDGTTVPANKREEVGDGEADAGARP